MNRLIHDLRYGFRVLRANPGFTIIAVLALALGIGATTAIFSVVNKVLLQPLPYTNAHRLVMLREINLPKFPEFPIAPGNFLDWQKQNTVFSRMAAYRAHTYILIGDGEPLRLRASRVTADLFGLLAARPALGRDFLPDEDTDGKGNVVILSHGFWQRRFGGDANILGKSVTLSGQPHTVIGVMPVEFAFPDNTIDLWAPMAFTSRDSLNRGSHFLSVVAALKPRATLEQAQAEMSTIARRVAMQYPDSNVGWGAKVIPLQKFSVRSLETALYVLLGAVGLVLLIACANVANLLLVRAAGRRKEISIRAALGASRGRVIRQLLTESVLLAVIGGAAGLGLAYGGLRLLLKLAPEGLPRIENVSIDNAALGFALALTVLTGMVFGLVPALHASRPNLNETLKEGSRTGSDGSRRQKLRSTFVVVEIALALVLLISAGLLIKSFVRLQAVNPGFNAENLLTTSIGLPSAKYREGHQRIAFFNQLLTGIASLPGVQVAGVTNSLPMSGQFIVGFSIQGRPAQKPADLPSTDYYAVSPDYFKAMGIPLLRGRLFSDRDVQGAPRVAIVSDSMAKRYFGGQDPIGQHIQVTHGRDAFREIVGIVGDVQQYGLDQASTVQTYEPHMQQPSSSMTLVIRTNGDPLDQSAAVRGQVWAVDKDQPVSNFRSMEQIVVGSVADRRFSMLLLVVFAAVALVLAAVGIYGVMAYSVTQRNHEIGIRVALGASSADVLRLVVSHGLVLAAIGVAIGLPVSFGVTRLLSTMLFGVSKNDATVFVSIPLIVAMTALIACWVPARRAAKVDPIVALRNE